MVRSNPKKRGPGTHPRRGFGGGAPKVLRGVGQSPAIGCGAESRNLKEKIMELGQVVFSKKGRDKGLPFIVCRIEGEYLYLVDGSLRKLAKPKKKKIIHLAKTNYVDREIGTKFKEQTYLLDSDIKKALVRYAKE